MVMIPPSARSGRDILLGGPQSRFALLQPRISGPEGSCKCLRVDLGGPRDEDLVSLLVVTSAPMLAVCAPGLVVMVMVRRNVLCSASAGVFHARQRGEGSIVSTLVFLFIFTLVAKTAA